MIEKLMNVRSSVRKFSQKPVEDSIILDLLDAARKAPSGGNEQQYFFGIIKNRDIIQQIVEYSYGQKWILSCQFIFALCSRIKDDASGGRLIQKQRFPIHKEEIDGMNKDLYTALNLEEHQTKIPGTIVSLLAMEYGIHSTWISRFDVYKIKDILSLPENIMPCELIAFGYPASEIKVLKKKAIDEITFYDTWSDR